MDITFVGGNWYYKGYLLEPAYNADGQVAYFISIHHMMVFTTDDFRRLSNVESD